MIGYKDMTFCTHWKFCKKAAACKRPLTDRVRAEAKVWWGGDDYPICVFTHMPDCHSEYKIVDIKDMKEKTFDTS